jgi:hypothetical protein
MLSGKELKIAAKHGLPVRCILLYFDPTQPDFDDVVVMEKAKYGYYIGPIDIEPEEYQDDEPVQESFPEGNIRVCAAPKVKY